MVSCAVIPVAGEGRRLRPISSAVPKALLPLVDQSGQIRAVLHWIVSAAVDAGVENVLLVVSPQQREPLAAYFSAVARQNRLAMPRAMEFIVQPHPAGFGDAVLQAQPAVGDDPFVLLLGDHVPFPAEEEDGPVRQVVSAWEAHEPEAMIGVQPVEQRELPRVGVVAGDPIGDTDRPHCYRCTAFREKPSPEVAKTLLQTDGLPEGQYLAHNGIYVFGRGIFEALGELHQQPDRQGELELAAAQEILLQRANNRYLLACPSGSMRDVGTPEGYANTFQAARAVKAPGL